MYMTSLPYVSIFHWSLFMSHQLCQWRKYKKIRKYIYIYIWILLPHVFTLDLLCFVPCHWYQWKKIRQIRNSRLYRWSIPPYLSTFGLSYFIPPQFFKIMVRTVKKMWFRQDLNDFPARIKTEWCEKLPGAVNDLVATGAGHKLA